VFLKTTLYLNYLNPNLVPKNVWFLVSLQIKENIN
jgi:hypothetical protein